jgi:Fe-S-cluster containining protein
MPTSPLSRLHDEIDARVRRIRENHPDWLCAKGCDTCCRRLAEMPRLTAAEWDLLRPALAALAPEQLAAIRRNLTDLASQPTRLVVCPLLERSTGACPVYAARPVACRSYGFYAQRELGLYCHEIESRVADGSLAEVVWGNHDAVDRQLGQLGDSRPLDEWFAAWAGDI